MSVTMPMSDDIAELKDQAARCRRLANALTDPDLRESLLELAVEYEAQLRRRKGRGFMLQPPGDEAP